LGGVLAVALADSAIGLSAGSLGASVTGMTGGLNLG
jgi:hypothetical protein